MNPFSEGLNLGYEVGDLLCGNIYLSSLNLGEIDREVAGGIGVLRIFQGVYKWMRGGGDTVVRKDRDRVFDWLVW